MVHVVSMLEVPRRLRSVSFQSKDVKGALNSLFLFCRRQTTLTHAHPIQESSNKLGCAEGHSGGADEKAPPTLSANLCRSDAAYTYIVQEFDEVRAVLLELPYPEVVPYAARHESNLLFRTGAATSQQHYLWLRSLLLIQGNFCCL
jgi:hypothetical protein